MNNDTHYTIIGAGHGGTTRISVTHPVSTTIGGMTYRTEIPWSLYLPLALRGY